MGYELNTEFIKKPHEWDPRRLYSQTGADWQYRVDFDRLRKERLQKTREQMELHDLGALVLFAGANIRYVTGSYQGNWKYNINIRYVVLPRGRRAGILRDGRIGPPLRNHRPSLDPAGEHPAGDHLAVGGRRRAVHGQEDGRGCRGRPEGEQG